MGVFIGSLLILLGLAWMAVTSGMYVITVAKIAAVPFPTAPFSIGLIALVSGLILWIAGLARLRKVDVNSEDSRWTSVHTRGLVTSVKKYDDVVVDYKTGYAIVEYVFHDSGGAEYTGRKEEIRSDLLDCSEIQKDSLIDVQYQPENPEQHLVMMTDCQDQPVILA